MQLAIASYESALQADSESFFPNYNLAVLLAGESQFEKALKYFDNSLKISQTADLSLYQLNVLINSGLCYE